MIALSSRAGMNQQEPTSEDPSAPSEPEAPNASVSRQNLEARRIVMPPHWALGYHEAYEQPPGIDELLRRVHRFQETDTPLASIQLPSETPVSDQASSESIENRLKELGVHVARAVASDTRRTGDGSAVGFVRYSSKSASGHSVSDRRLLFAETLDDRTPRDAAVTVPVYPGSRGNLRRMVARCVELSSRGFPLCGTEFRNIDSANPALVIRWVQLAAVLPLLRLRMTSLRPAQRSLWPLPRHIARTWRRYLSFRHKLFPYLYTTFDEYRQTGKPPIRTLPADADEPASTGDDRAFSLGSALAIVPVEAETADQLSIDLPEGEWFRFWTNDRCPGGQSVSVPVSAHQIPVFARAGSVVPLYPFRQRLDGHPPRTLVLRAYPYGSRRSAVYTDDGQTYAYENGDYHRLVIETVQNHERFVLDLTHEGERNIPHDRLEWQVPAGIARSAAVEERELPVYSAPRKFTDADRGIFHGHFFLRIRTPADVDRVDVKLKSTA